MIRIQKASSEDLQTIHDMAQVVFRHTYREILSAEQMEYMMDMMYSMPNLEKQMDEGHHYYIAFICGPETSGNVPEVDNVKSCESQVESSGDYVGAVPCPKGASLDIFKNEAFYISLFIFALMTFLIFRFKKLHPILIIFLSAVIGIAAGYLFAIPPLSV